MSENWEHDCWESAGANDAKASETQETLLRNIPKVLVLQNSSPHCDTHNLNWTKDGCMCIFSFQYSQTHILKGLVQLQVLDGILLVESYLCHFRSGLTHNQHGLGRSDSFAS